jgi:hypothetical protein
VRQGKLPQPYYLGGKRLWKWSEIAATIQATGEATNVEQGSSIYEATKKLAG